MSEEPPPVLCGDSNTWRHKGEKIDLSHLLQLIEDNGTPEGLDLHGCRMVALDLRPAILLRHVLTRLRRPVGTAGITWHSPWHGISLRGAHLECTNLFYVQLQGADLRGAKLAGADLRNANLDGARIAGADLTRTRLSFASLRAAHLQDARLDGAELFDTHLEGADLSRASMKHAVLQRAHLEGADLSSADLRRAQLVSTELAGASLSFADARGAELTFARLERLDLVTANLHSSYWYGAHLDNTRIFRGQLGTEIGDELAAKGTARPSLGSGSFALAREAYMALKTNFDRMGRYGDAAWAYVKEQRMHKADLFRHLSWRNSGSWILNWLADALAGYGEHWWKPLIWAVAVVLCFALGYSAAGNVASGDGSGTHDFLTALTHSIGAFATIGFNTLEPVGWGARLLTAIEAMFGIGLFALFVFTLGNRMRRS